MRKNLSFLLICILFGCSKENVRESNNLNVGAKLIQIITNDLIISYEYDDESNLIKIVSAPSSSGNKVSVTFEYENGVLMTSKHYIDGRLEFTLVFEYNDRVIDRKNVIVNDILTSYELYKSNASKIIGIQGFRKNESLNEFIPSYDIDLVYNQKMNVEKETRLNIQSNETTEIIYEYDSKINFLKAVPENAKIGWIENYGFSENNPVSQKWFFEGTEFENFNYSYEYNDSDFPIKQNLLDSEGNIKSTTTYIYE